MDDITDAFPLKVMLLPILLVFGVFFAIVGLIGGASYIDCRAFAHGTSIETKWAFGCYAKVGDQWVPKEYVFGRAQELRLKAKP